MGTHTKAPASAFLERQPGEPICFSRGVIFGHDQDLPFGGVPDETGINPNDGTDADLWVIDPSEYDDVLTVVIVNERCTRRASFQRWLLDETSVPPEDPPFAKLFVPERDFGRWDAAGRVQAWLDTNGIYAEAVSYHSPYVW